MKADGGPIGLCLLFKIAVRASMMGWRRRQLAGPSSGAFPVQISICLSGANASSTAARRTLQSALDPADDGFHIIFRAPPSEQGRRPSAVFAPDQHSAPASSYDRPRFARPARLEWRVSGKAMRASARVRFSTALGRMGDPKIARSRGVIFARDSCCGGHIAKDRVACTE
jgi:hypothetical protein